MQVSEWSVPGGNVTVIRPKGAPAWWHGDEDAAQSFLQAMGVMALG